ncbi:MAG TPA: serine/threonine-protein kinase [Kofleriaceae bacterium]|nr:serine/threonine-protein kinase [Kofleriaceae bacterium]
MSWLRERYRLGKRIGGGGMAEVLEATALGADGFNRPVAIKRMLPALTADPSFGQMFRSEAHLASLLHHPNIASVLDFDRDEDGSYFIVMELVRGLDLRQLGQSGSVPGPIPYTASAFIIGEVLAGLAYAHELLHDGRHLGIVHRDISPHNVMISWDGAVKVVDFGIAKAVAATNASRSGTLRGKVSYMSPEQAHGHPLDGRSDLFAVGVMFHELLTGKRLFAGGTEPEILARLLHQPIPPPAELRPDVPADLAAVAMRLLERDRRARYRSARATLEALLGCTSASARGRLDLQGLLRARFPDQVPRIPTAVRGGDSVAPEPARSKALGPALGSTFTGDYGQAPVSVPAATQPTPTAAGQGATGGRGGSMMWIAGGAGFMVAAAVILLVALSGGESTPEPALAAADSAAPIDAGAHRVIPPDAPASSPADAAPVPVVVEPKPEPRVTSKRRSSSSSPKKPVVATGPPGKLRISIAPWAHVKIGGIARGEAPATYTLLPGRYQIELTNDALGKRETVTIEVESGKTTRIERRWQDR